jgi:hypothetical protein
VPSGDDYDVIAFAHRQLIIYFLHPVEAYEFHWGAWNIPYYRGRHEFFQWNLVNEGAFLKHMGWRVILCRHMFRHSICKVRAAIVFCHVLDRVHARLLPGRPCGLVVAPWMAQVNHEHIAVYFPGAWLILFRRLVQIAEIGSGVCFAFVRQFCRVELKTH